MMLRGLQPLPSEQIAARRRAKMIEGRLSGSFGLKRLQIVGSHSRATAIRRLSDVDYFAVISRSDARWGGKYVSSATVLDAVRDDLRFSFPATDISRDGQAVTLRFGQAEFPVDVVPAIFREFRQSVGPVYEIPDGTGGWLTTSPLAHNRFIREADGRSGGKLKRTAQLIKFWRECRQPRVPLSSFHVELVLADTGVCEGAKSYSRCLEEALTMFARRRSQAYRDPLGISGYVPAARTESQRGSNMSALEWASDHASRAYDAEAAGNYDEAVRQWDIVFNGTFPRRLRMPVATHSRRTGSTSTEHTKM